ncbi:MAG: hypothetical protein CL840_22075 [Crocinitomicaceae bacterium]|nr:hypothetical protein [Crocinitomicaceae bacterium]|tara:strand:- start:22395 stop:23000 length:606 start_codon:yes stop_codon:yes gene_type:complete
MNLSGEELLTKAQKHYQGKEFEQAALYLNQLIEMVDDHPDYYEKLGMCFYHLGNLNDCLKNLTTALKLDPNNSFRYSSRAFIRNGLGDVDGAIEDYNKAIHLDPKDAIAHNNLGLLQEKKGFESSAKKSFEKADSLSEDFFNDKNPIPKVEAPTDQNSIDEQIESDSDADSSWKTIKDVFFTKKVRKEFLLFIKNGFKLDK